MLEVCPGHLGDGPQEGVGRHPHEPEAHPGRGHQRLEHPVLQEVRESARRVEEVERVPRWRSVDHHHVETALLHQLVELLHGHVLLGARQGPRQIAVDPVDPDVIGLLVRVGVPGDQVVERALGVEHERVQLTGPVTLDLGGAVGQLVHAEGVGQPASGVDGDNARGTPDPCCLQRDCCRGRGLADASRTAADDDRPVPHHVADGGNTWPS